MIKRFYHIISLLLLLAYSPITQAQLFNGEEFKLDNGMRVVVVPNHKAPIIKHMVWYKVGSVDEVSGKGGLAHLLEHLMFRGTTKVKGSEFNKIMEENGAESNAFTTADFTVYHQTADISRLELLMFLEADRMENLQISDDDFVRERDIVFQERKQRIDNNPQGFSGEEIDRILWQNHSYGRPVIGTNEDIFNLTKKDAEDFYRQYYAPDNAVLILAGDIEPQIAKKLAEKYYGKINKKAQIKSENFAKLKNNIKNHIDMELPEIKSERLLISTAAPSYNVNPKDVDALNVLAEYMGGDETAKLHKKLVLEQGVAIAVGTSYYPYARSYGEFNIGATPQKGENLNDLLLKVRQAWDEALSELNEENLGAVKQKMVAGLIYLRDNPETAAMITGKMAGIGLDLSTIERQAELINNVSIEDVRRAAKHLYSAPQIEALIRPEVIN